MRKSILWLTAGAALTGCAHNAPKPIATAQVPSPVASQTAPSTPPATEQETFDQVVSDGADGSVDQAKKEYGVVLDFSPGSVKKVDGILTKLHGEYAAKKKSNRDWSMECMGWGAYIGEVIRRQYGGHWQKVDQSTGNPLPLELPYGKVYPVTWSLEEIASGPSHGVWAKYKEATNPDMMRAMSAVRKT